MWGVSMRLIYFFALYIKIITDSIKWNWLRANYKCNGVRVARTARIILDEYGCVEFGKGVSIGHGALIVVTNEKAIQKGSILKVGENSVINEFSNIRASGGFIHIGEKCMIAQNVSLIAANHTINKNGYMVDECWDQSKTGINIGDNVWIGCGAIILPGVSIANGAVIAAGSVVTKSVNENEIVGGNPAILIRKRI